MIKVTKYENLSNTFPLLQKGLCNAIQNDCLEIKQVKHTDEKMKQISKFHPNIKNAYCVIYSPYVPRSRRDYETFIFIDEQGEVVDNISGREMQLYGVLEDVHELKLNVKYEALKNLESA